MKHLLPLPIVLLVLGADLPSASAQGELACRVVIPFQINDQSSFPIDPLSCRPSTRIDWNSTPRIPDSALFLYGTTGCPLCLGCSCLEGFSTYAALYDYSTAWRQDSAQGGILRLERARKVTASSGSPALSVYQSGYGPVVLVKGDTTSICWITRGDSLLAPSDNQRIVHCLSRTDTSRTFAYGTIHQEIRPAIGVRRSPIEPSGISHEGPFRADGRRERCTSLWDPRFPSE